MDDVVADWMGYAHAIVNRNWNYGERIPDEDWNKVSAKKRMYRDLPIKEGAHDLVNFCRDAVADGLADDLCFLTALPQNHGVPYAAWDKVLWAMERFERIPVLFGPYSFDKYKHCTPGDILIDDRTSNCEEWRVAGGHSHIYRSWEECKPWLESVLK